MPILNEIPSCGIVTLLNMEAREHYTMYSSSLPVELAKIIESLRKETHSSKSLISAYKANKLTLKVLDNKPDNYSMYSLRAEYTEWLKELESKGFTDLRPGHKAPKYRIVVKILNSFDGPPTPLVYVMAVSKRNNKLVLGVFNTLPEADSWVKANFSDVALAVPVFHDGELSRAYRDAYGERLIKLKKPRRRKVGVSHTL